MKSVRPILAVGFAAALFASAFGAETKPVAADKNPDGCDCGKDKDGKVCGVDKDCCCTGQKATKPAKKDDKDAKGEKSEKKEEKKDGKK